MDARVGSAGAEQDEECKCAHLSQIHDGRHEAKAPWWGLVALCGREPRRAGERRGGRWLDARARGRTGEQASAASWAPVHARRGRAAERAGGGGVVSGSEAGARAREGRGACGSRVHSKVQRAQRALERRVRGLRPDGKYALGCPVETRRRLRAAPRSSRAPTPHARAAARPFHPRRSSEALRLFRFPRFLSLLPEVHAVCAVSGQLQRRSLPLSPNWQPSSSRSIACSFALLVTSSRVTPCLDQLLDRRLPRRAFPHCASSCRSSGDHRDDSCIAI